MPMKIQPPVPNSELRPMASSATGLLAFLDESDPKLQSYALKNLVDVIDLHWAEAASCLPRIEELAEDSTFESAQLAAYVASKVFFHLEEYNDALRLALGAGNNFDVSNKSEFVSTLVSKCIDKYIELRKDKEISAIDHRLENIVERTFESCFSEQNWNQVIGIALESHRLDVVEKAIHSSDSPKSLLRYMFEICQTLVAQREIRREVLKLLIKLHNDQQNVDFPAIVSCHLLLGEAEPVSKLLFEMIKSDSDSVILAFQIAFDLVESENQLFIVEVKKHLPSPSSKQEEEKYEGMEVDDPHPEIEDEEMKSNLDKLLLILSGSFGINMSLSFMFKQCNTDFLILSNIKSAVETRNSVLHNATVVSHALMNAGTTNDSFLRDNLEWMGKASNWGKFSATASIGVVHKGHLSESMSLLQPYLPQNGTNSSSPYSEGGALYALGLIHANCGASAGGNKSAQGQESSGEEGQDILSYLAKAVRSNGSSEPVVHGACLGAGLVAMATGAEDMYEDMKNTLYMDNAVAGEAAAIGIGLLMLGFGSSTSASKGALTDMIAYAHETQHEKIIRGLAIGIAMIMYQREEEAEPLVEQLSRDRDPILRYGAMYVLGLAYCGTSSNLAVKRLLHVAVSDVSDDVRLAAVICIGFVMCRAPQQVPKLVSLLAESFNAHVRYGACMAIGVACAGSGSKEAMDVLEPMMEDVIDFVRQGATIAMAMVLMQQSEAKVPKTKAFRAKVAAIAGDKHQTTMTKMGAILAAGIIDAGGRNVTIAMESRAGFIKMSTVVGLALFCQHWFWYPLMHFLSLAFTPTLLIGLNKDLKMPNQWNVRCNNRPSMFAYPKKLEEKKEDRNVRVTTVTLSTTARARAREQRKELEKKKENVASMEVDTPHVSKSAHVKFAEGAEESKGSDSGPQISAKGKKKDTEPNSFTCPNPSRITPSQEPHVEFDMGQRYVPIRPNGKPIGIIMLKDVKPGEEEDVALVEPPAKNSERPDGDVQPPEPFEWAPN